MRTQLWDTKIQRLPAVIVAPASKGIDWNSGSIAEDEIQYGFGIAFIAAANPADVSAEPSGLFNRWDEDATMRFLNSRRLDGFKNPQTINNVVVQITRGNVIPPSEYFLSQAKKIGWDAIYLIVRYTVRQTRGN